MIGYSPHAAHFVRYGTVRQNCLPLRVAEIGNKMENKTPEVLEKLQKFMEENNIAFVCTAGLVSRMAVVHLGDDGVFTDYQFEEELSDSDIRLGAYQIFRHEDHKTATERAVNNIA